MNRLNSKIKNIIFDMNGTMIFDGKYHEIAWEGLCGEACRQTDEHGGVSASCAGAHEQGYSGIPHGKGHAHRGENT